MFGTNLTCLLHSKQLIQKLHIAQKLKGSKISGLRWIGWCSRNDFINGKQRTSCWYTECMVTMGGAQEPWTFSKFLLISLRETLNPKHSSTLKSSVELSLHYLGHFVWAQMSLKAQQVVPFNFLYFWNDHFLWDHGRNFLGLNNSIEKSYLFYKAYQITQ